MALRPAETVAEPNCGSLIGRAEAPPVGSVQPQRPTWALTHKSGVRRMSASGLFAQKNGVAQWVAGEVGLAMFV